MKILLTIGGAVLTVIAFAAILAAPVMWLWDWLMPQLFGLSEITLWQALGLLMLCRILFTNTSEDKS